MNRSEIIEILREDAPGALADLWRRADEARKAGVGDDVHLRGLVEISNYCARSCAYCGLRAGNDKLRRYRLGEQEILCAAGEAVRLGYGTIVMQAGEDYGIEAKWLSGIIERIKGETPLAVTLSLGERGNEELSMWRRSGADRYLLRFETSNRELYDRIHPGLAGRPSDRMAILGILRDLGYETGSGVMIGIPGQTYDDLADDIMAFGELELDMVGVGPWIANSATPLGRGETPPAAAGRQVPNDALMTYKVIALTRLLCPLTNIPATTALATVSPDEGRQLGLARGANVIMPNLTPMEFRGDYALYPGKACSFETPGEFDAKLKETIRAMGRQVGRGRGDSPVYAGRGKGGG